MDNKSNTNQAAAQQAIDATICSNDSASDTQGSSNNTGTKPGGKVKAYVDFSDFNRNYEEYLKRNGPRQAKQDDKK